MAVKSSVFVVFRGYSELEVVAASYLQQCEFICAEACHTLVEDASFGGRLRGNTHSGLADSIGQRLTVTQVIAVFTTYIIFIRVGLSLTPALAISFYITVKMIETKPVGVVA